MMIYEGPLNNDSYRNMNRDVNGSPTKVYIISPKKKEEETQTLNNDEDNLDIQYANRSRKRSKSKSQNWSRRNDY